MSVDDDSLMEGYQVGISMVKRKGSTDNKYMRSASPWQARDRVKHKKIAPHGASLEAFAANSVDKRPVAVATRVIYDSSMAPSKLWP